MYRNYNNSRSTPQFGRTLNKSISSLDYLYPELSFESLFGSSGGSVGSTGAGVGSAGASSGLSSMMAGGLWMLPVAAGIGLGLQANAEGASPKEILGAEGYGGTPVQGLKSLAKGDYQDVAEKLGGGGLVSGLISLIGGEDLDENLEATFGAPYLAYENIANKGGGSAMDWIKVFANPFTF